MLLPAIDATANGATELHIHSPDTDELVLPLRRYRGWVLRRPLSLVRMITIV